MLMKCLLFYHACVLYVCSTWAWLLSSVDGYTLPVPNGVQRCGLAY